MNIEPVSSIMTLQSQQIPQPRQVESAEKSADYNSKDASTSNAAPDLSTAQIVSNTSEAAGANEGDGNQQSNSYQEEATATNERLKEAVARFNKSSGANSEAVFGIHEGTNRVTIKIVDKKTKETIKELPPEKTLDMIAKVWEMAGIMVDEKR
ncbi:MAG: flagellar protein FlaG [Lachnospiraceae bacterium]|nr:flagellar protein FlaG [Lachnospiraceae bacterium]